MGLYVLDRSWQEDPVSWADCGHGSQFGLLLRPDAVLPGDAVAAEECSPCLLCHVDLVMIRSISAQKPWLTVLTAGVVWRS